MISYESKIVNIVSHLTEELPWITYPHIEFYDLLSKLYKLLWSENHSGNILESHSWLWNTMPWWFANFLFFIIQSGFIKMFFVPVLNTGTNVNSSKFITGSYQDN